MVTFYVSVVVLAIAAVVRLVRVTCTEEEEVKRYYIIDSWKRGVLTGFDPVAGERVGRFSPSRKKEDEAVLRFDSIEDAMVTFNILPEITQAHCRIKQSPGVPEAEWKVVHDGDE